MIIKGQLNHPITKGNPLEGFFPKSHKKIAQAGILLIFDKDINNINLVGD